MTYYESPADIILSLGKGNLPNADPLFINPAGYHFRLQTNSPAIGKTNPAYTPSTDLNGRARPAAPGLRALQH